MANIGGSGINASDYGQAATKAGAQNTINATNQAATNAANTGNVAHINSKQSEFNISNAQGVNAANTAAGTESRCINNAANLPQQQFNNELNKASGIAGAVQATSWSGKPECPEDQAETLSVTGSVLG